MKYRLGSLTVEAIETYVRVTVANFGGPDAPDKVAVTKRQLPKAIDVANLIAEIRGHFPDATVLQACGRASDDARDNKLAWSL